MRAHDEALPGNEYSMRMWDKGSSVDLGRGFCVIGSTDFSGGVGRRFCVGFENKGVEHAYHG